MGGSDNAAFSHLVLVASSGFGLSQINNAGQNFTYPGMHANFFIHGIIGFLHHQNFVAINCSTAYSFSLFATRYLALPCLMADLWDSNKALSSIHLVSAVLPFIIAVAAKDNVQLGQWVVTCNFISLVFYTFEKNVEWGWYAAGSAFISYFLIPQMKANTVDIDCSTVYSISLLATRYLTLPCLMADLWNSNKALTAIHLLSGIIPFGIAIVSKDNVQLGHCCMTCNFISLVFYSFDQNRQWGWYAAGSAFISYFLVRRPTDRTMLLYPVGLALLEYYTVDIDCSTVYSISLLATRYLTLPCLMADLWNSNKALTAVHLLSGIIPFGIAIVSKDNVQLGQWCMTCNFISLVFYSFDQNREWGWFAAGSAFISFFLVRQLSASKILYPVGLAVLECCVYRLTGAPPPGAARAARPTGAPARRGGKK